MVSHSKHSANICRWGQIMSMSKSILESILKRCSSYMIKKSYDLLYSKCLIKFKKITDTFTDYKTSLHYKPPESWKLRPSRYDCVTLLVKLFNDSPLMNSRFLKMAYVPLDELAFACPPSLISHFCCPTIILNHPNYKCTCTYTHYYH